MNRPIEISFPTRTKMKHSKRMCAVSSSATIVATSFASGMTE